MTVAHRGRFLFSIVERRLAMAKSRHLDNGCSELSSGKKDFQHDHFIAWLYKNYERNERWKRGAGLVTIYRGLIRQREEAFHGVSRGNAALNRGGTVRTMWVSKDNKYGLRKGAKVLSRKQMEEYTGKGVRFRTVQFPANKDVKEALKDMAAVLADVHHEDQYGFVPERDCVQSAAQHRWARTVLLLDIKDAFNQVTWSDIFAILHKGFRINNTEARQMADLICGDGAYLYQGNPIAPALYNIRATWLCERLHRLCVANGLRMTMYADDVCISSSKWDYFSKRFVKTVLRICAECGLQVNLQKVHVHRVSPYKIGHYDITGLVIDYDENKVPYVRPIHRRRTIKKADFFAYLQESGMFYTEELNKLGQLKDIKAVENGLRNWAERKNEPFNNADVEKWLAL